MTSNRSADDLVFLLTFSGAPSPARESSRAKTFLSGLGSFWTRRSKTATNSVAISSRLPIQSIPNTINEIVEQATVEQKTIPNGLEKPTYYSWYVEAASKPDE